MLYYETLRPDAYYRGAPDGVVHRGGACRRGVLNLLTGPGGEVGAHLVAHPHVDLIAFTGSREVGLKIWEAAGRTAPGQANLKKVVCEMGGKNCVIVDSDADLDEAVVGCIASAFGYQGQKCSALSRLVVLADNYERFLERLIAAARRCVSAGRNAGNIHRPGYQPPGSAAHPGRDRGREAGGDSGLAGQCAGRPECVLCAAGHFHGCAAQQPPVPRRNLRPGAGGDPGERL